MAASLSDKAAEVLAAFCHTHTLHRLSTSALYPVQGTRVPRVPRHSSDRYEPVLFWHTHTDMCFSGIHTQTCALHAACAHLDTHTEHTDNYTDAHIDTCV